MFELQRKSSVFQILSISLTDKTLNSATLL